MGSVNQRRLSWTSLGSRSTREETGKTAIVWEMKESIYYNDGSAR